MSFFNSAKEFFGLAPVDVDSIEHDDAYYADERESRSDRSPRSAHVEADRYGYETQGSAAVATRPRVAPAYEPTIVSLSLESYNDALKIGDPYRDGDIVVYEVTDADRSDARRLIDFGAGLSYGSHGEFIDLAVSMDTERLVFAIVPQGADVTLAELEHAARLR